VRREDHGRKELGNLVTLKLLTMDAEWAIPWLWGVSGQKTCRDCQTSASSSGTWFCQRCLE
jgi:hypothetical protein